MFSKCLIFVWHFVRASARGATDDQLLKCAESGVNIVLQTAKCKPVTVASGGCCWPIRDCLLDDGTWPAGTPLVALNNLGGGAFDGDITTPAPLNYTQCKQLFNSASSRSSARGAGFVDSDSGVRETASSWADGVVRSWNLLSFHDVSLTQDVDLDAGAADSGSCFSGDTLIATAKVWVWFILNRHYVPILIICSVTFNFWFWNAVLVVCRDIFRCLAFPWAIGSGPLAGCSPFCFLFTAASTPPCNSLKSLMTRESSRCRPTTCCIWRMALMCQRATSASAIGWPALTELPVWWTKLWLWRSLRGWHPWRPAAVWWLAAPLPAPTSRRMACLIG